MSEDYYAFTLFFGRFMKEISFFRLLRFSITASIIITLIAFIFNVGIASAETGTISLSSQTDTDFVPSLGAGSAGMNFSRLHFDVANYNSIDYISAILSTDSPFILQGNTTFFTCVSPNICEGFASYNKYGKIFDWSFAPGNVITVSPIELIYETNIYDGININVDSSGPATVGVSSTNPVCIAYNTGVLCVGKPKGTITSSQIDHYLSTVFLNTDIDYLITYPIGGKYSGSITKHGIVQTKIAFEESDGSVDYIETTFNNLSFVIPILDYGSGLYINASTANTKIITLINASNASLPATPNIPADNIQNGIGLVWEFDTYNLNVAGNISWSKTTPIAACDNIKIYNKFNDLISTIENPGDTGFYKLVLNSTGTWKAQYNRKNFCIAGEETLNTAYTSVTEPVTSYLVINSTTIAGRQENVTYKSGLISSFSPYLAVINSDGNPEGQFSISGYSINNEGVSPVVIVSSGQHVIKICDAFGCDPVVAVTNTIFNTSIPTINIAKSNITLDKTSYQFEDTAIVSYSIDSLNFSNKAIIITSYNWDYGIEKTRQVGLTNQTGSYEELFSLFLGRYSHTGQYSMRLVGRNQSGDYILAFWNFTILDIDAEGYKLTMSKSELCKGESNTFVVMSPTTSYLNITLNTNGAVFSSYYINQSKTISYKPTYPGTYSVLLLSPEGYIKRAYNFDVKNCAVTPPTSEFQNGEAMQQKTDDFLSTGMFIVLIVLILFAGAGLEFGGVGGGIIGFGSGFLFLAIYGFVPLWALFLFAILIITVFSIFVATKTTSGGD